MCTLAVLWKCHPASSLIIAQCRDELLARPALDVARWRTDGGVDVVAGRDALAGGTWFGIGPHVVAGLTNRRDALGPRRGERSRGEIVTRALEQPNVSAVREMLGGMRGEEYGPFSLLAVDDDEMIYADNERGAVDVQSVSPGVHVLGNFRLDNESDPVVKTVGAAVRALLDVDEATLTHELREILAKHGDGWPCVHLDEYGTRSAGVFVRPSRYFTTDGKPCTSPWRDSSELLSSDG